MIIKRVPGFPDYEVSENGEIFSYSRWGKKRIKKPSKGAGGYYKLQLVNNDGPKMFLLHRLICITFHGYPPSKKHEAAHQDGNKDNNHFSNFKWMTPLENTRQKQVHGTQNKGETQPMSVLSQKNVLDIRKKFATGKYTQRKLASIYGVTFSNISCIILRKSWKHI